MLKTMYIFFDFSGTLVKMRPATPLINISLLKKLSERFKLGIITGAKRSETENVLKKLKIYNLFQIIITADDNKLRKPNPKLFPNLSIYAYIGDTIKDKLFAKNAGVTFFRVNKKYNINQIIGKLL